MEAGIKTQYVYIRHWSRFWVLSMNLRKYHILAVGFVSGNHTCSKFRINFLRVKTELYFKAI